MDRSVACFARLHSSVLDRELARFFHPLPPARGHRVDVRRRRARRASRRFSLATTHARQTNQMGATPALTRALTLNGADGRRLPLELPLAAIFSSCACDLRGRSAAHSPRLTNRSCVGAAADCCDNSDVDLWCGR